jgi:hypothetical protein
MIVYPPPPVGSRVQIVYANSEAEAAFQVRTGRVVSYEIVRDFVKAHAARMMMTPQEALDYFAQQCELDIVWPVVAVEPAGPFKVVTTMMFNPDFLRVIDFAPVTVN